MFNSFHLTIIIAIQTITIDIVFISALHHQFFIFIQFIFINFYYLQ